MGVSYERGTPAGEHAAVRLLLHVHRPRGHYDDRIYTADILMIVYEYWYRYVYTCYTYRYVRMYVLYVRMYVYTGSLPHA